MKNNKHYIIRAENNGLSWLVIHEDGSISKEFTVAGKAHSLPLDTTYTITLDTTDTLTRDDIDSVIGDIEIEHKHRIRQLIEYSLIMFLLFFSSIASAQTSQSEKKDTILLKNEIKTKPVSDIFTGKYYGPNEPKHEIWRDTTGAFFFTLPNGRKLYIK